MVFESLVASILNKYLVQYVQNLDPGQLKISVFSGDVRLNNLHIKSSLFDTMDLPTKMVSGVIGSLKLSIPWKNLYYTPSRLEIEDVTIALTGKTIDEYKDYQANERKIKHSAKMTKLMAIEEAQKLRSLQKERVDELKQPENPQQASGYTERILAIVIKNLILSIKNVNFIFSDEVNQQTFQLVMHLGLLEAVTTDDAFKVSFDSSPSPIIHKLTKLEDFSVRWQICEPKVSLDVRAACENKNPTYIISPLYMSLQLELNTDFDHDCSHPKVSARMNTKPLELCFSTQFCSLAFSLREKSEAMAINAIRQKYIPNVSVAKDPKLWWNCAANYVYHEIVLKYRKADLGDIFRLVMDVRRYRLLFKKSLKHKDFESNINFKADRDRMMELEEKLAVVPLIISRKLAKTEFEKEQKAVRPAPTPQPAQSSSWISWLNPWGGSSAAPSEDSTYALPSDSPLSEIASLSSEDLSNALDSVTAAIGLAETHDQKPGVTEKRNATFYLFDAIIESIELKLLDENQTKSMNNSSSNSRAVVNCCFKGISLSYSQHPDPNDFSKIDVKLHEMVVYGPIMPYDPLTNSLILTTHISQNSRNGIDESVQPLVTFCFKTYTDPHEEKRIEVSDPKPMKSINLNVSQTRVFLHIDVLTQVSEVINRIKQVSSIESGGNYLLTTNNIIDTADLIEKLEISKKLLVNLKIHSSLITLSETRDCDKSFLINCGTLDISKQISDLMSGFSSHSSMTSLANSMEDVSKLESIAYDQYLVQFTDASLQFRENCGSHAKNLTSAASPYRIVQIVYPASIKAYIYSSLLREFSTLYPVKLDLCLELIHTSMSYESLIELNTMLQKFSTVSEIFSKSDVRASTESLMIPSRPVHETIYKDSLTLVPFPTFSDKSDNMPIDSDVFYDIVDNACSMIDETSTDIIETKESSSHEELQAQLKNVNVVSVKLTVVDLLFQFSWNTSSCGTASSTMERVDVLEECEKEDTTSVLSLSMKNFQTNCFKRSYDMNLSCDFGCFSLTHALSKNICELFNSQNLLQLSLKMYNDEYFQLQTTNESEMENDRVNMMAQVKLLRAHVNFNYDVLSDICKSVGRVMNVFEASKHSEKSNLPSPEKSKIDKVVKHKPSDASSSKILSATKVLLESEGFDLRMTHKNNYPFCEINLSGFSSSAILHPSNGTFVNFLMKNISVRDVSSMSSLYPDIVSVSGSHLINCKVSLPNKKPVDGQVPEIDTLSPDITLDLEVNQVNFVFVYRFVSELTEIFSCLSISDPDLPVIASNPIPSDSEATQSTSTVGSDLYASAARAVEDVVDNIRKIKLSLDIKAPVITIPSSSSEPVVLKMDLGHLSLQNSFCTTKMGSYSLLLEITKISLSDMVLSRFNIKNVSAMEKRQILGPVAMQYQLTRKLSANSGSNNVEAESIPDISFEGGSSDPVVGKLSADDLSMLMTCVQENMLESSPILSSFESNVVIVEASVNVDPMLPQSMMDSSQSNISFLIAETCDEASKSVEDEQKDSSKSSSISVDGRKDEKTIKINMKFASVSFQFYKSSLENTYDFRSECSTFSDDLSIAQLEFSQMSVSAMINPTDAEAITALICLSSVKIDDRRHSDKPRSHTKYFQTVCNAQSQSLLSISYTKSKDNNVCLGGDLSEFSFFLDMGFLLDFQSSLFSALQTQKPSNVLTNLTSEDGRKISTGPDEQQSLSNDTSYSSELSLESSRNFLKDDSISSTSQEASSSFTMKFNMNRARIILSSENCTNALFITTTGCLNYSQLSSQITSLSVILPEFLVNCAYLNPDTYWHTNNYIQALSCTRFTCSLTMKPSLEKVVLHMQKLNASMAPPTIKTILCVLKSLSPSEAPKKDPDSIEVDSPLSKQSQDSTNHGPELVSKIFQNELVDFEYEFQPNKLLESDLKWYTNKLPDDSLVVGSKVYYRYHSDGCYYFGIIESVRSSPVALKKEKISSNKIIIVHDSATDCCLRFETKDLMSVIPVDCVKSLHDCIMKNPSNLPRSRSPVLIPHRDGSKFYIGVILQSFSSTKNDSLIRECQILFLSTMEEKTIPSNKIFVIPSCFYQKNYPGIGTYVLGRYTDGLYRLAMVLRHEPKGRVVLHRRNSSSGSSSTNDIYVSIFDKSAIIYFWSTLSQIHFYHQRRFLHLIKENNLVCGYPVESICERDAKPDVSESDDFVVSFKYLHYNKMGFDVNSSQCYPLPEYHGRSFAFGSIWLQPVQISSQSVKCSTVSSESLKQEKMRTKAFERIILASKRKDKYVCTVIPRNDNENLKREIVLSDRSLFNLVPDYIPHAIEISVNDNVLYRRSKVVHSSKSVPISDSEEYKKSLALQNWSIFYSGVVKSLVLGPNKRPTDLFIIQDSIDNSKVMVHKSDIRLLTCRSKNSQSSKFDCSDVQEVSNSSSVSDVLVSEAPKASPEIKLEIQELNLLLESELNGRIIPVLGVASALNTVVYDWNNPDAMHVSFYFESTAKVYNDHTGNWEAFIEPSFPFSYRNKDTLSEAFKKNIGFGSNPFRLVGNYWSNSQHPDALELQKFDESNVCDDDTSISDEKSVVSLNSSTKTAKSSTSLLQELTAYTIIENVPAKSLFSLRTNRLEICVTEKTLDTLGSLAQFSNAFADGPGASDKKLRGVDSTTKSSFLQSSYRFVNKTGMNLSIKLGKYFQSNTKEQEGRNDIARDTDKWMSIPCSSLKIKPVTNENGANEVLTTDQSKYLEIIDTTDGLSTWFKQSTHVSSTESLKMPVYPSVDFKVDYCAPICEVLISRKGKYQYVLSPEHEASTLVPLPSSRTSSIDSLESMGDFSSSSSPNYLQSSSQGNSSGTMVTRVSKSNLRSIVIQIELTGGVKVITFRSDLQVINNLVNSCIFDVYVPQDNPFHSVFRKLPLNSNTITDLSGKKDLSHLSVPIDVPLSLTSIYKRIVKPNHGFYLPVFINPQTVYISVSLLISNLTSSGSNKIKLTIRPSSPFVLCKKPSEDYNSAVSGTIPRSKSLYYWITSPAIPSDPFILSYLMAPKHEKNIKDSTKSIVASKSLKLYRLERPRIFNLYPCMKVENLLPYTLNIVQKNNSGPKNLKYKDFKIETERTVSVFRWSPLNERLYEISVLEYLGNSWSGSFVYDFSKIVGASESVECVLSCSNTKTTVKDDLIPTYITIRIFLSFDPYLKMTFTSPLVAINKSDKLLAISFPSKSSINDGYTVICKQNVPIMLPFNKSNEKAKISIVTEKTETLKKSFLSPANIIWSSAFSLSAIGTVGSLECHDALEKDILHHIGYSIESTPISGVNKIIFTSFCVILNELVDYFVGVRELPDEMSSHGSSSSSQSAAIRNSNITKVPPRSTASFWPSKSIISSRLQAAFVDDPNPTDATWDSAKWTSFIPTTEELIIISTSFPGNKSQRRINVQTVINETSSVVRFQPFSPGTAPILIYNITSCLPRNIYISQTARNSKLCSLGKSSPLHSHKESTLASGEKMLFTWEDYLCEKNLKLSLDSVKSTNKHPINSIIENLSQKMSEAGLIGDSEKAYGPNVPLMYYVIFLDGIQRVILLCDDLRYVCRAMKYLEPTSSPDMKLLVSMDSIGLSLVHSIVQKDLLYLSISSESQWSTWNDKKNEWVMIKNSIISESIETAYNNHVIFRTANRMRISQTASQSLSQTQSASNSILSTSESIPIWSGINVRFGESSNVLIKTENNSETASRLGRAHRPGLFLLLVTRSGCPMERAIWHLNYLQLDNPGATINFPVILYPLEPPKSLATEIESHQGRAIDESTSAKRIKQPRFIGSRQMFLQCSFLVRLVPSLHATASGDSNSSKIYQITYFKTLIQEFSLNIEISLLNNLYKFLTSNAHEYSHLADDIILDNERISRRPDHMSLLYQSVVMKKVTDISNSDYVVLLSSIPTTIFTASGAAGVSSTTGSVMFLCDYVHLSPLKIFVSFSASTPSPTVLSTKQSQSGGSNSHSSVQDESEDEEDNESNSFTSYLTSILPFGLVDVGDAELRLACFEMNHSAVSWSLNQIISSISDHYRYQVLRQSYVLVLGLDVIGNPYYVVSSFANGAKNFFYEPYLGLVQGPNEFLKGLSYGVKSLVSGTVGNAAGALSKIAGSVGKGIAALTFDESHVSERKEAMNVQPKNIQEGVLQGSRGFLKGVVSGISGVVTKPIEGASSSGVGGFFTGLGKGLIGAVTKPVGGLVDFAGSSLKGIKTQTSGLRQVTRLRRSRPFYSDGVIRDFHLTDSEAFFIFYEIYLSSMYQYLGSFCSSLRTDYALIIFTSRLLLFLNYDDILAKWEVVSEMVLQDILEFSAVQNTIGQYSSQSHSFGASPDDAENSFIVNIKFKDGRTTNLKFRTDEMRNMFLDRLFSCKTLS